MTVVFCRVGSGVGGAFACLLFAAAAAAQNPAAPAGQPYAANQASGPQAAVNRQAPGQPYGPQPAGQQQNVSRQNFPQNGPAVAPQGQPTPHVLRAPLAPFQLTPPQEQYLNQVLEYWEFKSKGIERFRCKFTRWEYDPVFGPKDPFTAKTESLGSIMYSAPDKGLFKIEKVFHYTAPQGADQQPRYEERADSVGEHWVCDGASVFEYNHTQKKLVQYQLPPEMRGQAIANSPLPFIFGANAKQIKERFWMRVITPTDAKGEYWLEAYPKNQADAVNYQKIEIILDEKDYLPKAIQVFDPTYDVRRNPKRTAFMFEDRDVNWNVTLQKLNLFHKEFYEPAVPNGWKKEVQNYDQSPGQSAPPRTATNSRSPR